MMRMIEVVDRDQRSRLHTKTEPMTLRQALHAMVLVLGILTLCCRGAQSKKYDNTVEGRKVNPLPRFELQQVLDKNCEGGWQQIELGGHTAIDCDGVIIMRSDADVETTLRVPQEFEIKLILFANSSVPLGLTDYDIGVGEVFFMAPAHKEACKSDTSCWVDKTWLFCTCGDVVIEYAGTFSETSAPSRAIFVEELAELINVEQHGRLIPKQDLQHTVIDCGSTQVIISSPSQNGNHYTDTLGSCNSGGATTATRMYANSGNCNFQTSWTRGIGLPQCRVDFQNYEPGGVIYKDSCANLKRGATESFQGQGIVAYLANEVRVRRSPGNPNWKYFADYSNSQSFVSSCS
jgi:hypothetical protein